MLGGGSERASAGEGTGGLQKLPGALSPGKGPGEALKELREGVTCPDLHS